MILHQRLGWAFARGTRGWTCQVVQAKAPRDTNCVTHLSVGSTWTYLELPATNVTMARSMAAAGMAKPIVQLTLSWMYTKQVTARNEPRLMAK